MHSSNNVVNLFRKITYISAFYQHIQWCAILINKVQLLMKSFCFAPFKINWFLTCAAGNREMIFVGLIALYWCEQVHLWSSKSVLWLSIVLSRWNQAKWGHTCYTKPNHTRESSERSNLKLFCNRTIIEREDFLPQAANQISVEGTSERMEQWVEILKNGSIKFSGRTKLEFELLNVKLKCLQFCTENFI